MTGDTQLTPNPTNGEERHQRDTMRIKNVRYGFFKVAKEAVQPPMCVECLEDITTNAILINDEFLHEKCFNLRCARLRA